MRTWYKSCTTILLMALLGMSQMGLAQETEIKQAAISTQNPAIILPSAGYDAASDTLVNGLSPTQSYQEYGTEGAPKMSPVPFAASPCNGGSGVSCHYPTNKWFTDILFYARGAENDTQPRQYMVGQTPYNLYVHDDAEITHHAGFDAFDKLPGFSFAVNPFFVNVVATDKPYKYGLYKDTYHSIFMSADDAHFRIVMPYERNPMHYVKADRKIVYQDQLSLATEWTAQGDPSASMTAYFVRGTPYMTVKYKNLPFTAMGAGLFGMQAGELRSDGTVGWLGNMVKFVEQLPNKKLISQKGNVFRILLLMNDYKEMGKQASKTLPRRYFEYLLITDKPVHLTFTPEGAEPETRPFPDKSLVTSDASGNRIPYDGIVRLVYVGSKGLNTEDNTKAVYAAVDEIAVKEVYAPVEAMLLKYANVYPIGANIRLFAGSNSGRVQFDWKTAKLSDTSPPNWQQAGGTDPVLMMAFKTQALDKAFTFSPAPLSNVNYQMDSIKGPMLGVLGASWSITVPFADVLQGDAASGALWYGKPVPAVFQEELKLALKNDIALLQKPKDFSRPSIRIDTRNDSYGFGKEVSRVARLGLIAEQLGDQASKNIAMTHAQEALNAWFVSPQDGGRADRNVAKQSFIKYDPAFGGAITARASLSPNDRTNCVYNDSYNKDLCGYMSDFYNGQYTDHHFHYGYFLYTAAVLAKLHPEWLSLQNGRYKQAVDILARDIANPNAEADPYFAQYRMFDWFEGHGFANGLGPKGSGRNQESTSEAVNAWYGLVLWGEATNNKDLANIGRIMTMLEIKAAQDYTQINPNPGKSIYEGYYALYDSSNHPFGERIDFNHLTMSGINWASNIDHNTFFGLVESYIVGMQMMPYTPVSDTLFASDWLNAHYRGDAKEPNAIERIVDKLVHKITLFQMVNAGGDNIFKKFLAEWSDCQAEGEKGCKPSLQDFMLTFEGVLNNSYQWGSQSILALAKVNPRLAYDYIAFNTNGRFFQEMQKVNDAFWQEGKKENGMVSIRGLSPSNNSRCVPVRPGENAPENCYHDGSAEGPMGWPLAKLNYDQIDKGNSVTNMLWYVFSHMPSDTALPPALFWLDDSLTLSNMSGYGFTVDFAPAALLHVSGSKPIQYTVETRGQKPVTATGTTVTFSGLKPDSDYRVAVTALAPDVKGADGQPVHITRYVLARTLGASVKGLLTFNGSISHEVDQDKQTVTFHWPEASCKLVGSDAACSLQNFYEVKSLDDKTSYCNVSAKSCDVAVSQFGAPDQDGFYHVRVLAKNGEADTIVRLYSFKLQTTPPEVVPVITWDRAIAVSVDDAAKLAIISWNGASGIDDPKYTVIVDGQLRYSGSSTNALSVTGLAPGSHAVSISVKSAANAKVLAVIARTDFMLQEIVPPVSNVPEILSACRQKNQSWVKVTFKSVKARQSLEFYFKGMDGRKQESKRTPGIPEGVMSTKVHEVDRAMDHVRVSYHGVEKRSAEVAINKGDAGSCN